MTTRSRRHEIRRDQRLPTSTTRQVSTTTGDTDASTLRPSRSTAGVALNASAPLPLAVAPFPASRRSLPRRLLGPSCATPPWTSHGTLASQPADPAFSPCRFPSKAPGPTTHSRGRSSAPKPRGRSMERTRLSCRDVVAAGTPTDTSNGHHRGGNDTFPDRQRHAARGGNDTQLLAAVGRAIARLLARSRCSRAPAAGEPVPGACPACPSRCGTMLMTGRPVLGLKSSAS